MSSNSKSNNNKKDEAYSDIGNETLALDEVINNAKLDLVPRTDSDEEHQRIDSVQYEKLLEKSKSNKNL